MTLGGEQQRPARFFFVSLSREDVDKMVFASPVGRMPSCLLDGAQVCMSSTAQDRGRQKRYPVVNNIGDMKASS